MENVNQLLKPAAFLNVVLINVFFENWLDQKIIDFSERVFDSGYVLYNIRSSTFAKS